MMSNLLCLPCMRLLPGGGFQPLYVKTFKHGGDCIHTNMTKKKQKTNKTCELYFKISLLLPKMYFPFILVDLIFEMGSRLPSYLYQMDEVVTMDDPCFQALCNLVEYSQVFLDGHHVSFLWENIIYPIVFELQVFITCDTNLIHTTSLNYAKQTSYQECLLQWQRSGKLMSYSRGHCKHLSDLLTSTSPWCDEHGFVLLSPCRALQNVNILFPSAVPFSQFIIALSYSILIKHAMWFKRWHDSLFRTFSKMLHHSS